jgi:spore coat polysaccharide biosynthesis protein SpsF (cytidylyltransferase family)
MPMNPPPLCIVQARYHSTRLPRKMLLPFGDETLIARAVRIARDAFGPEHVVVAIPASDEPGPLGEELRRIGAPLFAGPGPEADVLARLSACAHRYRWHPSSVIVRYTPDDPFKQVDALRRVAAGERLPVELGGEAFTLAMLDAALAQVPSTSPAREHITDALFPSRLPQLPDPGWTIDTEDDYRAALCAQTTREACP